MNDVTMVNVKLDYCREEEHKVFYFFFLFFCVQRPIEGQLVHR